MAVLEHTGRVTQFDHVLGRSALIRHRSLHWAPRHQHHLVVLVIKSFFDKIIATAALIVFSPILALIALAILLDDGGPVLFTQTRVGQDGQQFTVLKFRTMVPDAELRKEALLALNESDGVLFKMRRDPRITTIGSFLRRTSLDELPQLLNVVLGEMSLVGPRPALPAEAALYSDERLPPAGGQARDDRTLADQRPVGPELRGRGPARPAVRGELDARARPADSLEDLRRRGQR